MEKIIPVEKNHKVGVELIEIHALSAEHSDPTAVGFKLFCPKFTVAYTGDTQLTPKLMEELVGSDLLILNVPYPGEEGTGMSMNLDVNAAIQIISHVKPRMAILTHFGLQMLKADPIVQAGSAENYRHTDHCSV